MNGFQTKKKYKIAMVCACPFPTGQGSQVFIKQLSRALLDSRHEVHLVTYHFGEEVESTPLTIHRIPGLIPYGKLRAGPSWRKPLLDILLIFKLIHVVKRYNIEIIHAHNYEAALSGYVARFFTGTPVLFHTHGVMGDELHTYFKSRFSQYIARKSARILDKVVARWADYIIAINHEIKLFFCSIGINDSKVDCIPPGIYFPETIDRSKERIQEKYNIGQGPMVIYTGNLDQYQNLEFLLKSFRQVLKEIPGAKLVMLTNCETEYYEKLSRDLGIFRNVFLIKHLGFAQEQLFLKESILAVLPRTSWSGFPIKLLNYMAAGKAVVACEGSAKGIEHLEDGLIVENNHVAGFADSIITLINDVELCRKLGYNAEEKIKNYYTWEHISVKIEELYDRMLEGKDFQGSRIQGAEGSSELRN